jgi:hypothetical protein
MKKKTCRQILQRRSGLEIVEMNSPMNSHQEGVFLQWKNRCIGVDVSIQAEQLQVACIIDNFIPVD